MNGYPRQLLVSIGISAKLTEDKVQEIYGGIRLACEQHGVDLVGGDTTPSLTGLTLSCTAIGECEPDKIVYRDGAQPNDLVCVSGSVGAAYMGLLILEREKKVFEAGGTKLQFEGHNYVIGKYLKPEARRDTIDALRENDLKPTAMLDISKGLATETLLMCRASNVGVRLYLEKIPVAHATNVAAAELNYNAATAALNGGEDYELLFTLPVAAHERIKDLGGVDIIGHTVSQDKGTALVSNTGELIPLTAQGLK
jgi:thiamine-monophosphate kinase